MANNSLSRNVYVIVRDKETILFEDEARAITSFNEKGIFDVLPLHENFISIIKKSVIIHRKTGQKHEIKIDNGILKVFENKINIYLGLENKQL